MKRLSVLVWLTLAALMAEAAPTAAIQAVTSTPRALAVAVGVTSHHVFALSGYGEAGTSWVTTLDARTRKPLRTVGVAAGGQQILVDDSAGRALVISGAPPGMVASTVDVTALDAKTGKVVRTLSLGKGVVRWTQDVSEMGTLYAIVGPASTTTPQFGEGSMLYAINVKTLKVTHTLSLKATDQAAVVQALSSNLFIADAGGKVRLYNVVSWKELGQVSVPEVYMMWPDRHPHPDGFVLTVTGKERDALTLIDGTTGSQMASLRYPGVTGITDVAHLEIGTLVISVGPESNGVPSGNGLVTALTPGDVTLMAQTPVGVHPLRVLIDRATYHGFVLSYDRVDAPGGWKSRLVVSTIDLATGKRLKETPAVVSPVSGAPDLALDSAAGRLYLTGTGVTRASSRSANQLVALDTKTGKVVGAVPLPSAPTK